MTRTERDDDSDRGGLDGLAGEYVLGTLDAGERAAVETRLESDAALRVAVAAWESRLQPLSDSLAEIDPPRDLLDRIVTRIDPPQVLTADNRVDALCRSLRRWRIATALAASAAVFLASTFVIDNFVAGPERPAEFVAVLTSEGAAPQFVAMVNVDAGTISVRRIGEPPPSDKSYELWAVAPDSAPESLGVISEASFSRPLDQPLADLTLAISLEPEGGSPTGAPTGPVVFSGSLVATE